MKDVEAISRREEVFDLYRKLAIELDDAYVELSKLQDQLNDKSKTVSETDQKLNELNRLIAVMISKDCCPVEARLKYPELINPPEEEKYDRYNSVGAATNAYPNKVYTSPGKISRII